MLNNSKFDWYDYYKLAKSFKNENDSAKLRTGIGRFYYSTFLESRDLIINEKLFLDKDSKKTMMSSSGEVHRETRTIFNKHKKLNNNRLGKK